MKKTIITIIIILILGGVGFGLWSLYVANQDIVIDEASPLDDVQITHDAFEGMDEATMEEFMAEMKNSKDVVMEKSEAMPSSAGIAAQGAFKPRAHEVAGKALLIDVNGKKTLRFENFETINGPKLHIYLSSSLGEDDFIDLGPIKATKGNVNYELPDGIDTDRYDKVLVWCVPFRVLFSYAELN